MLDELRRVDPDSLTPLQALALLAELKKRIGLESVAHVAPALGSPPGPA